MLHEKVVQRLLQNSKHSKLNIKNKVEIKSCDAFMSEIKLKQFTNT